MGIMVATTFDAVAVTAAQDLFSIVGPSLGVAIIHRCIIGQTSDFGDAQAENLRIQIIRGHTTAASGGSTATAQDLGSTGATFTNLRVNDTTVATSGTPLTLHNEVWNVASCFDYLPTPETRIIVPNGIRCVVRLPTAPADSLTVSGTLVLELV
jgi:hypothetical protein